MGTMSTSRADRVESKPPSRDETHWIKIAGLQADARSIGRELKRRREGNHWTLQKVSDLTSRFHPKKSKISPAQISRIESGAVLAGLMELKLLCLVFECDLPELLRPSPPPWFVIRKSKSDQWLDDVLHDRRSFKRQSKRHHRLIETGTYK